MPSANSASRAPISLAIFACICLCGFPTKHGSAQVDERPEATEVASRILTGIEIVLDNHITPPTIQQMLLTGLLSIAGPDKDELQPKLARELSKLAGREELVKFLANDLSRAQRSGESWQDLEARFLASLVESVDRFSEAPAPGYVSAKQFVVEQQLRDNRYVGIGIALQMNVDDGVPVIAKTFPRGPAQTKGAMDGDIIESIDEQPTKGLKLHQVIERLRGRAGEPVSILVRQPAAKEARKLDIIRGEVPFDTVVGVKQDAQFHWQYEAESGTQIAYVKLDSIRGSTARELKETASRLHTLGFRAVILDLRNTQSGEFRHATMIADQLLGKTTIGWLQKRGKKIEYKSDADSLFSGWPMCVLVGPQIGGQAEWIAAALQDQKRGVVLGAPTPGNAYFTETFSLEHGGAILLTTGKLLRENGQSLASDPIASHYAQRMMLNQMALRMQKHKDGSPAEVPGMADEMTKWRPGPGWHGIRPDEVVADPQARALTNLKERLSSESEKKS